LAFAPPTVVERAHTGTWSLVYPELSAP
jgi:hypothetical protein